MLCLTGWGVRPAIGVNEKEEAALEEEVVKDNIDYVGEKFWIQY